MFLKILLNYILGYVNIKVEGFFIERFINICVSKKILLMDIKREKSTIMYANVGIPDYKKLKQVARKTKSKIKIQRKIHRRPGVLRKPHPPHHPDDRAAGHHKLCQPAR